MDDQPKNNHQRSPTTNMSASAGEEDNQQQQQQPTSNMTKKKKTSSSSLWQIYCTFVQKNHVSLELLDAALSRILFWTPTTTTFTSSIDHQEEEDHQAHRNREILYGILSLHRLAMDAALSQQQQETNYNINTQDYSYGMTVRPNPPEEPKEERTMTGYSTSSQQQQQQQQLVSPTTIRIAITLIQSLLPSILEIARSSTTTTSTSSLSSNNRHRQQQQQQQQRARLYVERIKFTLRMILLGSYWKRMIQQQRHKTNNNNTNNNNNSSSSSPPPPPPPLFLGIMTEGGLFHGFHNNNNNNNDVVDNMGNTIPTIHQEDSLWERRNYVGRRTGRTVVQRTIKGIAVGVVNNEQQQQQRQQPKPQPKAKATFSSRVVSSSLLLLSLSDYYRDKIRFLLIIIGEILYAYRPLYWANAEQQQQQQATTTASSSSSSPSAVSYRSWFIAIAMDLISLQCCSYSQQQQQQQQQQSWNSRNSSSSNNNNNNQHDNNNNAATQTELSRRKMRLLLYLLRSPVWDRWTGPSADRFIEDWLDRRVPVVGRLVSTYLRDWLWYTKHPYVSEQG